MSFEAIIEAVDVTEAIKKKKNHTLKEKKSCPSLDLNLGSIGCEAEVLTTTPQCFIINIVMQTAYLKRIGLLLLINGGSLRPSSRLQRLQKLHKRSTRKEEHKKRSHCPSQDLNPGLLAC